MRSERQDEERKQQPEKPEESGLPGGGIGRRDEPGHTGVYPMSAPEGASPDAPIKGEMGWGQGERGAEGYYDSGSSETMHVPEEEATEEGARHERQE
ncbi:MAG: hypothetical protein ACM3N4_08255 [Nitrososphaerota archaeon]